MNIALISDYLHALMIAPSHTPVPSEAFEEDEIELKAALINLGENIAEISLFQRYIAEGDLSYQPQRANELLAPLKDLQSTLRHLTWQSKQIAAGDYGQKVEFLGEFSDAFNIMIEQLKQRENTLEENHRMAKELLMQENRRLEEAVQHQVSYYRQLSENQQDLQSYRHDMKNHFLSIESLLQKEDLTGAKEYIHNLSGALQSQAKLVDTDNIILDALLSDKIAKMKQIHAEVDEDIKIHKHINIDNADWCMLFGNALDNIYEALLHVDETKRKCRIRMELRGNMLIAVISNTMHGILNLKDGVIQTKKEDVRNHGIGIANMRKTVEKYHGVMKIETKDEWFHLNILLIT